MSQSLAADTGGCSPLPARAAGSSTTASGNSHDPLERLAAVSDPDGAEPPLRSITASRPDSSKSKDRLTRVAIVAPSLRYVGGQSAQADLLLNHWRKDGGLEVRFIPHDPRFPSWLRWAEAIPYVRTVLREPLYWAKLWSGLRDVDVVHIFSASYWSFLLAPFPAWVVARWRGKAALINYHSGEAEDHLKHGWTARAILRRVQCLVVPSPFLAKVFEQFGIKSQVVPNLVDEDQFKFRLRDPLRPVLVCARGFHRYYSVDLVARAFGRVQQAFPEARLILAGTGPAEREIRALVESLKLKGVEFTGAVPRHQMGSLYDRADIFINASWLDNMPMSVLEAFASGIPVVSTGPEGIRYIVEHERTGLLCDPGDWQSLGQNVIRLLQEPQLGSRLATAAYQECRKYRWECIREQWLGVYRSLAGVSAARSAAHE
ncbi:MAG: glycosyltransferase family 4 protein [Terriglobia bacterium]